MSAVTTERLLGPVHLVTIGTSDLARAVDFYSGVFGYRVVARGELPVAALAAAWRIPAGLHASFAVLAPEGAAFGWLRFVQYDAPGRVVWEPPTRITDAGLFMIGFRVRSFDDTWSRLLAHGARRRSGPSRLQMSPVMMAMDAIVFDPDGLIVDVHELEGDLGVFAVDFPGPAAPLGTVCIHAGDLAATRDFYVAAGHTVAYEHEMHGLGEFLGFPPDLVLRNLNVLAPEAPPFGRIEMSKYVGYDTGFTTDLAVPPNLGLHSLSFRVRDLDAATAALERLGACVTGRTTADLPPLGPVALTTLVGRSGEAIELFAVA